MAHAHTELAEPDGARVLARGLAAGDLHVELLQQPDGSVAVAFGMEGDGGALRQWPAGDIENGVRTFLSLIRRRGIN